MEQYPAMPLSPRPGKGPQGAAALGPVKGEAARPQGIFVPSAPAQQQQPTFSEASSWEASTTVATGGAATPAGTTPRARSRSPERGGLGPRSNAFSKAGSLFSQWFSGSKGSSADPVGPAPSADAAWLETALRASLTTFGESVEARLQGMEGGVKAACAAASQASSAAETALAPSAAAAKEASAALDAVRRHDLAIDEMQKQWASMRMCLELRALCGSDGQLGLGFRRICVDFPREGGAGEGGCSHRVFLCSCAGADANTLGQRR